MVLLRGGLVVSIMFIFLVVPPVFVVEARTRLLHEEIEVPGVSETMLRESDCSVGFGSPSHIDPSFSGRKMLAAEAPTQQLDGHASTVSSTTVSSAEKQSTSTTPAAPARFKSRFAFLFRSLAKGGSPPSTGTPSPGHN